MKPSQVWTASGAKSAGARPVAAVVVGAWFGKECVGWGNIGAWAEGGLERRDKLRKGGRWTSGGQCPVAVGESRTSRWNRGSVKLVPDHRPLAPRLKPRG